MHHGYANGVGPRESATLLSPEDREMLCFYSGSATHPARMHMLQVITNNSLPCFTETTRGFLKGMTTYVFSALMQNSGSACLSFPALLKLYLTSVCIVALGCACRDHKVVRCNGMWGHPCAGRETPFPSKDGRCGRRTGRVTPFCVSR